MANPFADLIPAGTAPPSLGGLTPLSPPRADKPPAPNLPTGYRMGANGVAEPIPGVPVKPEGKEPVVIPPSAAAGIQENFKTLRALDDALKALDSRPESIGPGTGMLGDTFTQFNDPDGTGVRAGVGAVGAYKIHDLSGAAVSASEAPRFSPFVPTVSDRPEVARAKLLKFRDALKGQIDEGLAYYGPENGYKPYVSPSATAFKSEQAGAAVDPAKPNPDDIHFGPKPDDHNPFTPDEQASYDAWTRAHPQASAGELGAFLRALKPGYEPDTTRLDQIIEARNKGAGYAPGSAATQGLTAEQQAEIDDNVKRGGIPGAAVAGAADTALLGFSDELSAGTRSIAGALQGKGAFSDLYDNNLATERGYQEAVSADHPVSYTVGQVAGGFALPSGGATSVGRLAAMGAGYGGAYGAGSADGSITDRLVGAGLGAGTGAVAAGAFGLIGNHVSARLAARGSGRVPPAVGPDPEVARAAGEEGIRISRPIVDPRARNETAFLESSIGGSGHIQQGLAETRQGIEGGVASLAGPGTAQEPSVMGQRIQDAGVRWIDRSRAVAKRAYDRAASLAGNATVTPSEALTRLDGHIAELSQNANSNKPLLSYLKEVRADLTDANGNPLAKGIGAIRDIRTGMRGQINSRNLSATDAERRVGDVLDGAKADITRDLSASSPQATSAYDRADRIWKERSEEIKQVVQRVIGKKDDRLSGAQVMDRIKTLSSKDGGRHARIIAKLDPDEAADYTATVAESLGRKSPDDEFSPAYFVRQVEGMDPQAARTTFGADGAKSIANLRTVSAAYRDTIGKLNNSRSGMVNNWREMLGLFAKISPGSLGAYAAGGTPGALAAAGAQGAVGVAFRNIRARTLMNPDVSKWLARAAQTSTPRRMEEMTRRLGQIAASEPAIANDILPLKAALESAVGRAAAEQEQGGGQQPIGQEQPSNPMPPRAGL